MRAAALIVIFTLLASVARADATVRSGDLEMHSSAVPSLDLTPEAARDFNVSAEPGRGLLTITVMRKTGPGRAITLPAQVYAGAVDQNNYLFSIPIREVRNGEHVYYLGEFRMNTPSTLRFLVSANVLGKPLKSEFAREFQTR
jgi:hypothetical protein